MNSILVREPQKKEHEKINTAGRSLCFPFAICTIVHVSGHTGHVSSIDILRFKLTDLSMVLYVG